jgi:hypothetical protein
MSEMKQHELAETVFDRNQRREAEINDALKQEQTRREPAVRNMYRLQSLRLKRDAKSKTNGQNYESKMIEGLWKVRDARVPAPTRARGRP